MKHLTIAEKQLVIQLHVRGFKKVLIAKIMKRGICTIYNLIKDWKITKMIGPRKRRQSGPKLTAQQVFKILRYFLDHPFNTYKQCIKSLKLSVCSNTVKSALEKNGVRNYVACKRQFLSLQNQIRRLKFALTYQHWTKEQWMNVSFMDEKTIQTYANGRVQVKRRTKERNNTEYITTTETQNSRDKVNLFGSVSFNGPNVLYSISTCFTGAEFDQLLKTKLKNVLARTVLLDNAPIHTKASLDWLMKEAGIRVFNFPPKSPDLNIIENVWSYLQRILNRKLLNVNISSKEDLLQLINESWKEVPASFIKDCILSMPDRLKSVIKMKGRQTQY